MFPLSNRKESTSCIIWESCALPNLRKITNFFYFIVICLSFWAKKGKKNAYQMWKKKIKKKFTNFLYVVIRGSFGTNQLFRIIYGCLILFHHWDQTKVNPRGQFHKYEHFRELQGKFEIPGGQFAIDPNPKRCLCISAKVK